MHTPNDHGLLRDTATPPPSDPLGRIGACCPPLASHDSFLVLAIDFHVDP